MIPAQKSNKIRKLLRSLLLENIKRFIALSSNIICFIRANARILLTSIQHTLSHSSLRVKFTKIITLVDDYTNRSSFAIVIEKLLRLHLVIFFIYFDAKTNESLRFCSKVTGPGQAIFHLQYLPTKVTALTNEREEPV